MNVKFKSLRLPASRSRAPRLRRMHRALLVGCTHWHAFVCLTVTLLLATVTTAVRPAVPTTVAARAQMCPEEPRERAGAGTVTVPEPRRGLRVGLPVPLAVPPEARPAVAGRLVSLVALSLAIWRLVWCGLSPPWLVPPDRALNEVRVTTFI